jgi:arylsulfatase A-like enzyme
MARHPAVYAPGAAQSLWIDLSLAFAVDGPPDLLRDAVFAAPVLLAFAWWLREAVRGRAPRGGAATRLSGETGGVAQARTPAAEPPDGAPVRPRGARFSGAWRARPVVTAGAVGVVLAIVLPASPPASPRTPSRPHILLVAVDSLRADHLDPHPPGTTSGDSTAESREAVPGVGDPRVTPNLEALAREAHHFTRAVPTIPRTYPSWASMLTGQYPHHHGIRHMFPVPDAEGRVRVSHTLPEQLRALGYRTAVFSDFAGDVFTRADFGFDHVDAPAFTLASNVALGGVKLHLHLMPWLIEVFGGRTHPELQAFERLGDPFLVTARARDFIDAMTVDHPETPWLVVVFLSSGHFPFASPSPYWQAFVDPDYRGPSRFHKETFGGDFDAPARAAEAAHLRNLHAGAIAASDAAIGELLAALEAADLTERTLRVITADHGECLYEHGLGTGHGDHLYGRGTLEVPLIVAGAGLGPRVENAPVSLTDLTPTLLGRLGVPPAAPEETVAGRDLVATPPEVLAARAVFTETDLWFHPPETRRLEGRMLRFAEGLDALTEHPVTGQIHLRPALEPAAIAAKHRAILTTDRKLVYIPTREGARLELYAPLDDPGDTRDLAAREPATRDALATRLYAWMRQDSRVEERLGLILPRLEAPPAAADGEAP